MFDDDNRDDIAGDEDYRARRPRRYSDAGSGISARAIVWIVVLLIFLIFVYPTLGRSRGSGYHRPSSSASSGGWSSGSDSSSDSSDWDTGSWDTGSDSGSWNSSSDSSSWDSGWDSGSSGSDSGSWDSGGSDSFDSGSDSGSW